MKRKIEMKGTKVFFITETKELKRIEEVPKQAAIDLYRQSKEEKERLVQEINKIEKKIKSFDIKKDEELERFIELANKAAKYNEYRQAQDQRDNMLSNLNNYTMQIEDLEKAIPELKRAKK